MAIYKRYMFSGRFDDRRDRLNFYKKRLFILRYQGLPVSNSVDFERKHDSVLQYDWQDKIGGI